jgi:WD40 repeat protein
VSNDSHGRDHALRIWRLNTQDEVFLDKTLPVDEKTSSVGKTNEPWLFHSLAVNALNFCPFDLCCGPPKAQPITDANSERSPASDMFVAVPNALNTGGIDIFHLPSERRVSTISPDPSINTGMVMTVNLFFSPDGDLCVVSGYEDGRAIVHVSRAPGPNERNADWIWECVYANQAHSQPILSLGIRPTGRDYFLTSSADALLVKHPLPLSLAHLSKQHGDSSGSGFRPLKVMNTKHAGQQGLRIRSDDKIFVTAGWDSRIRVYSCKTMKELAVLKWHKDGCYAISLADVNVAFELDDAASAQGALAQDVEEPPSEAHSESKVVAINPEVAPALATIKLQRSQKAQLTHWIAAGSKDGKISLWDIY